ncbi:Acetyltransferase (GNAT) domain-containing protein [Ekhidna lutea]|uniref:Acetyltransferase (GNAT) domain-containing protein n=1 Tax=Ekhidna lutea TaxID=447679 RepID=A0A239L8A8_EKHLU|nr:GNAT family N-acetyltransferase [Ekhidna lutea]SNT26867.1 Acetyltransferase (GNAT) domain-containing protein [Ekhidna lutea]
MNRLEVEKLDKSLLPQAYTFLELVFTKEQHIPKELIPLPFDEQFWWCVRSEGIVGTVAAWKDGKEWHWGRLAVGSNQRGHGLGKKLAVQSFSDLFQTGVEEIVIDARDITVKLLLSLGAKVTGSTSEFYSIPITPMILTKEGFEKSQS